MAALVVVTVVLNDVVPAFVAWGNATFQSCALGKSNMTMFPPCNCCSGLNH